MKEQWIALTTKQYLESRFKQMKDLTKGNPTKLIFQFAIPVFLGNVCQLAYNLIDTRIVGETLGQNSLAAVGATNSVNTLIIGFLIGLTNGFAINVARNFGANNLKEMRKSVAAALVLGVSTALILTILSVMFLMPLLKLLNTPEEVIRESYAFIKIIFMGMIAALLYNICASVLRGIGDTFTPFIFLILSAITNIVLDYFFILDLNMGVEGAAYATVISQVLSVVLCVFYIYFRYPILHLKREDFKINKILVLNMYSSGISMGFMLSLVSLGSVALQSAINTLGTNTIVAHMAARKITEIFMLMFGVFGTTMATYCGQNLGAGKIDRIKLGIKKAIMLTWIWCIGVMIASYTIVPWLVHIITDSDNAEIIHTATLYLRIDTLFYFVPAMISILRNSMQGIGDRITPIVSSMIELVGKFLVVIFLVPKLAYMGVIWAEPIVWILMVIPLIVKMVRNPIFQEKQRY